LILLERTGLTLPNILYHTKIASPLLTDALALLGGGTGTLLAAKGLISSAKPAVSNLMNSGLRKFPKGKRLLERQLGDSFARGYEGRANASGHTGKLLESAKNILMSNTEAAHGLGHTVRKSFPEVEPSDMAFLDHLRKGRPDRAQRVLDKYPRTKEKVRNLIGGEPDLSHPRVGGGVKDIMDRVLTRDRGSREELKKAVQSAKPLEKGLKSLPRAGAHVALDGLVNGYLQAGLRASRETYQASPRVQKLADRAAKLLPKGTGHNRFMDAVWGGMSPATHRSYGNLVNSLRKNNG